MGAPKISNSQSLSYYWSNSVFIGQVNRDGGWSEWSSFGTCSADSENPYEEGNRVRTRSCDNPPKLNFGQGCDGPLTETKKCQGFHIIANQHLGKNPINVEIPYF